MMTATHYNHHDRDEDNDYFALNVYWPGEGRCRRGEWGRKSIVLSDYHRNCCHHHCCHPQCCHHHWWAMLQNYFPTAPKVSSKKHQTIPFLIWVARYFPSNDLQEVFWGLDQTLGTVKPHFKHLLHAWNMKIKHTLLQHKEELDICINMQYIFCHLNIKKRNYSLNAGFCSERWYNDPRRTTFWSQKHRFVLPFFIFAIRQWEFFYT